LHIVACHISFFLKYLDSLEDFRKNPHVKIPPKYPCTHFQSLPNSRIQIKKIGKGFYLIPPVNSDQQHRSTQEAFQPRRLSRPPPSSGQVGLSRHPGRAPPHTAIPASPPPSFLLHGRRTDHLSSPIESPPLPTATLFCFNAETIGINTATTGRRPCSLPSPKKGARNPAEAHRPHLHSPFVTLAQSTALTEPLQPPPPLSVARPSCRLSLPGEVPSGFVTSPSPFSAATSEHQRARATSWPLSGELLPCAVPGSWCTRGAPGPHNHEPGPWPFSIQELFILLNNFRHFAFSPLPLFKINPQSTIFEIDPRNFPKLALDTFRHCK
jgi:hypothetical protein